VSSPVFSPRRLDIIADAAGDASALVALGGTSEAVREGSAAALGRLGACEVRFFATLFCRIRFALTLTRASPPCPVPWQMLVVALKAAVALLPLRQHPTLTPTDGGGDSAPSSSPSPSRRPRVPAPSERLVQLVCTAIYFLTSLEPSRTNAGRFLASPLAVKALLQDVVGHPGVTDNAKTYAVAARDVLVVEAGVAP
jgi:hypothetical protein